ncbi:hypothetical protein DFO73_10510 [Cytobacillus oceanisediminis]|jgi:hypothetical protein|uniref:Uncharacterized protein n=1 Tax=Cytobacillus oceanisediminis TaxID=665099 RepID=A0A2V3A1W6_9BACI|nr:hypothetical protein [Cytobacillus oceanisediminis]PWW28775.1 hypothetical protein DFO73_10510 [Cytobacillus oceanisediminis]
MFIIILLLWAAGLYILFRSRDEEEDLLFLKLIGYYILGSFTFNLNGLVLPVGFVISLFLKPKLNKNVKRGSAIFGLIMMILGLFL